MARFATIEEARRAAAISAARARARTHCKNGHPLSGNNLYLTPKTGKRNCRICRRVSWNRMSEKMPTADQARRVIASLRDGLTIGEAVRGTRVVGDTTIRTGSRTMRWGQFQALRRSSSKLSRLIDSLVLKNAVERKRRVIHRPRSIGPIRIVGYELILATTSSLPDHLRDDVRQDMFLAAAEGRLRACDVAVRIREFVCQRNRMFSKYVPVIGGRMLSVDQRIFDDGDSTIGDTVTRTLWQGD